MNTEEIEKAVKDIMDGIANPGADDESDYTPEQRKALISASFLAEVLVRFYATCSNGGMGEMMTEGATYMLASHLLSGGGEYTQIIGPETQSDQA